MRLKHYAATIFIALLAAFTLSGAATVGASANVTNVGHACLIEWGVNAPGTDHNAGPGDNRNYEFLRFTNTTGAPLDVEGWWVQDNFPHVYKLEANKAGAPLPVGSPFRSELGAVGPADDHFVMPAGSQVYVYNGAGTDGNPTNLTAALYRNYVHHFNNAGDTMSIHDSDGTTVSWVTFTPFRTRHAC